ncbi:CFAP65, partial [Symbiodinium necroappetens]
QLKPFQLLFGTAAVESGPTVVYLALSNPGYLPIRFSFQTPENLNLENVPYWCDEKALVDEREAHFSWVEEHGVYDIQPRSGAIPPGDFLH